MKSRLQRVQKGGRLLYFRRGSFLLFPQFPTYAVSFLKKVHCVFLTNTPCLSYKYSSLFPSPTISGDPRNACLPFPFLTPENSLTSSRLCLDLVKKLYFFWFGPGKSSVAIQKRSSPVTVCSLRGGRWKTFCRLSSAQRGKCLRQLSMEKSGRDKESPHVSTTKLTPSFSSRFLFPSLFFSPP